MDDKPNWRAKAEALEYFALAMLVAGSFIAGAWGLLRWLAS